MVWQICNKKLWKLKYRRKTFYSLSHISQQKFSRKVLVPQTTAVFMTRVSQSYVPFTYTFPMLMHFVPIHTPTQVLQVTTQFLCF